MRRHCGKLIAIYEIIKHENVDISLSIFREKYVEVYLCKYQ